jgi:hypothetical protein
MRNRISRATASTLGALWLSACGGDRGSATDGTGSITVTTTADGSESGGDGESGSERLDVGDQDGTATADDGGGEMGCKKVDFLFVIDNSGSMADEQDNLIASFPGFIATIQAELEDAQDYHIMVIDSDAWVFGGCEGGPAPLCTLFNGVCPLVPGYQCGVTMPEECEDVLGAGVTHPKGPDASGMACNFTTGKRFMDSGEPDLHAAFSCAAKVGTGSTLDPEKPMEAMVQAASPSGPAHDCNEGFFREDAILVVTFITDEDDDEGNGSNGTPDGWKASIVAQKSGDETAIVVLGLFGDNDQPNAICPPFDPDNAAGAEPSVRLRQFAESFGDRGFIGSICADSYDPFFQQAVSIIESTCSDFVPPG